MNLMIDGSLSAQPRVYTQALGKGRALIAEMQLLLRAWEDGEAEESLAERVLREDTLGKATARRTLDVVHVFSRRLLQPTDLPARHLKPLASADGGSARRILVDLLFFFIARQDNLLWDFTVDRYWPSVRDGQLTIANRHVADLLWEAERDGRIPKPWSEEAKRDMAGRVLGFLSDVGLLEEFKPAKRRVVRYQPSDGAVLYLAHLLHDQATPDGLLAEQPAWRLFGLLADEVWSRLELLAGDGWFVLQRAGQVVRVTWRYPHAEDVTRALAGS